MFGYSRTVTRDAGRWSFNTKEVRGVGEKRVGKEYEYHIGRGC